MKQPMRLLVVDDEADMRNGLVRILRSHGYQVATAVNGEDAVKQAGRDAPDGVLMDIRMPGIDGVEAYRRIRAICPNSFVVFMTAHSDLLTQALTEGGGEVLVKPFDIDRLQTQLEYRVSRVRPGRPCAHESHLGAG